MKKIISLVMGVGMLALVAGCSDDSSDSGDVACNAALNGTVFSCMTGGSMTEKACTDGGGTVVDSCGANPLLTCTESGITINYYDQSMVDLMGGTCTQ